MPQAKVPFDMKMSCFQLIVKHRDSIFTWNFLASYARKIAFLEIEMTYWETKRSFIKGAAKRSVATETVWL